MDPADRRRFGRRPSSVNAYVELPGKVRLPCIIENISDGGALLRFTEGAAPTQSFRLMIEGTPFNLLCELRHKGTRQLGVRFMLQSEGIALNNFLQRKVEAVAATELRALPARRVPVAQQASVRALRLALLGRAKSDAVAQPSHEAAREEIDLQQVVGQQAGADQGVEDRAA